MTQSLELIHAGVPYATPDTIEGPELNNLIANAETGWVSAVGAVTTSVGTGLQLSNLVARGALLWGVTNDQRQITVSKAGVASFIAASGIPAARLTVCFDAANSNWVAFPNTGKTHYVYIGSGLDLTSFTGASHALYFDCYSAIHSAQLGAVLAVGADATRGVVAYFNGNTLSSVWYNTAAPAGLTDIANDGGNKIVAVGPGASTYSTDGGATLNNAVMLFPSTMIGAIQVCYSAALGLFIASALLSTGELCWTTSTDGSAWTQWRKSAQIVMPTWLGASRASGIAVLGKTWVAPCAETGVQGVYSNDRFCCGVLVSVDSGASWRRINAGAEIEAGYLDTKAVKFGDRVALVSSSRVAVSGPVALEDKQNSVWI